MSHFVGIGTDLVDLDRFRGVLDRRPAIRERIFTDAERAYADQRHDPVERYAVRFAAKEAVLKALGVGLGSAALSEIEVRRDDDGRPSVALSGRAAELAAEQGVTEWRLTLTHDTSVAQAIAVALGPDAPPAPPPTTGPGPKVVPSDGRERPDPNHLREVQATGKGEQMDPLVAGALVPVVTPEEMAAIDRAAPEPVEVLIGRAGSAVARAALGLLGGTYGRRVVVLAGKGNNGGDGRDAARRLRARGVRVTVIDAAEAPAALPAADLVIDAAYGTGFRGDYRAPDPGAAVLAVDIPSGVDGLTGQPSGRVLAADATVTFAALKPGLLLGPGLQLAGAVSVADIGLDVSSATTHLVGAAAVGGWLPSPRAAAHKWQSAVWIVAGSPGMSGAAALCSAGAQRAGAGYVRLSTPGGEATDVPPEVVRVDLPPADWAGRVLDGLDRFSALVVGNGLGTGAATAAALGEVVAGARDRGVPTVVEADGLTALGRHAADVVGPTTVLTPHDGEFARLAGGPPGDDRIAAARSLAAETGAVVLLKGRATVVAAPDGSVLVSTTGDERLATAGTGDVLAGVIGALLAQGLAPARAAAAGAFIHGRAGALGWPRGLVAGDLPDALPAALAEVSAATR